MTDRKAKADWLRVVFSTLSPESRRQDGHGKCVAKSGFPEGMTDRKAKADWVGNCVSHPVARKEATGWGTESVW